MCLDVGRKCDAILPHVRAEVVWVSRGDDDVVRFLGGTLDWDWGPERNWGDLLSTNKRRDGCGYLKEVADLLPVLICSKCGCG